MIQQWSLVKIWFAGNKLFVNTRDYRKLAFSAVIVM